MIDLLEDGIRFNGEELRLPFHIVIRELGRGANGIVLLTENNVLRRKEAVKIWLRLRASDNRDKIKQGISEAQKIASTSIEFVPQIYSADVLNGRYFYMTMEPLYGQILEKFLLSRKCGAQHRCAVANGYLKALYETLADNCLHGDPHTRNVIVCARDPYKQNHKVKLLDFGTSIFYKKDNFERRHWSVCRETILRIFCNHPSVRKIIDRVPLDQTLGGVRLNWYWEISHEISALYSGNLNNSLPRSPRFIGDPFSHELINRDDLLDYFDPGDIMLSDW